MQQQRYVLRPHRHTVPVARRVLRTSNAMYPQPRKTMGKEHSTLENIHLNLLEEESKLLTKIP